MPTVREYRNEAEASFEQANAYLDEIMNEVFRNDVLRETILGHVIRSPSTNSADICSVRLVQKTWLRDVARLAVQYNVPLACLQLTAKNSLSTSQRVQKTGQKLLDQFVATMEHSADNLTFPFSLEISKEFFCYENQNSFTKFLTSVCAKGMLKLDVNVPEHGGSMLLLFPETVSLPGLKSFNVEFCDEDCNEVRRRGRIGSNLYFTPFLQFLLRKAVGLREFDLSTGYEGNVPAIIRCVALPPSLTTLSVDIPMDQEKMELLAHSSFPNLVSLSLGIDRSPLADELIYQILGGTKATLRHLKLMPSTGSCNILEKYVKYLRFPVMKRLETCWITSYYVELGSQDLPLPELLPKLKKLKIDILTEDTLRKWTEAGCFPNVTTVEIIWERRSVFKADDMEGVHKAFPNLTAFYFRCSISRGLGRDAVLYLFKNLTKLTALGIFIGTCDLTSTHYWDSLFCGIPLEAASQLSSSAHPQLYDYAELEKNSNLPSIRDLTSLRELTLAYGYFETYESYLGPLISDQSFHHACMRMPSLKLILMTGRFSPSPEIATLFNMKRYGCGTYICSL